MGTARGALECHRLLWNVTDHIAHTVHHRASCQHLLPALDKFAEKVDVFHTKFTKFAFDGAIAAP